LIMLIISSSCSAFLVLILISFKESIIRLAGACWYYYLWMIIFIPWIGVLIPLISFSADQTQLHIQLEQNALKHALILSRPLTFRSYDAIKLTWLMGVILSFSWVFLQHVYFTRKLKQNSHKPTIEEEKLLKSLLPHKGKNYLNQIYFSTLLSSPLTGHL